MNIRDSRFGYGVLCFAGADGVKTKIGEYIPGGGGAVVLIPGIAVVVAGEALPADPVQPIIRFFLLAQISVHKGNVERGLVGDGALPPVIVRHFGHLVDLDAVTAHQIFGGGGEESVQLFEQCRFAAVQFTQPFDVVLHSKAGLPGCCLGVVTAPGDGGEGFPAELAGAVLGTHKAGFFVKEILIPFGAGQIQFPLIAVPQFVGHHRQTIVEIGGIQRQVYTLVKRVKGDVSEL